MEGNNRLTTIMACRRFALGFGKGNLVGGFNPFEKYARQIESFPPKMG